MAARRIQKVLVAWLALSGFSCALSPLVKINVAESKAAPMHSEMSERFKHADALLREFAKDWGLSMAPCGWIFPDYGKTPDPCIQYERAREEGIRVAVFRNSVKDTIELVVAKERRVFGQHSRAEVEAGFFRRVVEPLQKAYGTEAVNVVE